MSAPRADMPQTVLADSRYGSVRFARTSDGSCPALEFWNGLPKGSQAKFLSLFRAICSSPQLVLYNQRQFKLVEGKTFEFKRNDIQSRIFCFRYGSCWYLVSGFSEKKEDALPRKIVNEATRLTAECLSVLAKGS